MATVIKKGSTKKKTNNKKKYKSVETPDLLPFLVVFGIVLTGMIGVYVVSYALIQWFIS